MFDLVTIGETMIRLTPPGLMRLEQADQLQIHVGGSESNTAVGLARLGRKVAWVSRLTRNSLGQLVERQIRMHGVDTRHVQWTDDDRVGTYYFEPASAPRASRVIYDRAGSAFSKMSPSMLPEDLFQSQQSKWLLVTGITLGLGPVCRELVTAAVKLARESKWKICFDVNYRGKLWGLSEARAAISPLFEEADLVFVAQRDLEQLWGIPQRLSPDAIASELRGARQGKTTVVSLAEHGAMANQHGNTFVQRIEPVEPIGRLGGGDAFSAGFLHSWLEDDSDLEKALRWGTTVAAIKYSMPGDMPWLDRQETERLVKERSVGASGTGVVR